MTDISCNIIKDLLPLYVEGLTSEDTNKLVEAHIAKCEDCGRVLSEMSDEPEYFAVSDEETGSGTPDRSDAEAIDFMKKSNRKLKRGIIFGVIALVAVCLCLVLARGYFASHYVPASMIELDEIQVEDGKVRVEGALSDSSQGVRSVDFSFSEGELEIGIRSGLKTPFTKNEFYGDFSITDEIKSVRIGRNVIWDRGTKIPETVSDVYAARHSYIGDMPENGNSASALGIPQELGAFTNKLITGEEPYGWIMYLSEDMGDRNAEKLNAELEYYSAMLIATIDNLSYVEFEYASDGEDRRFRYTEEDADRHLGGSVKEAAKTASGLMKLMKEW